MKLVGMMLGPPTGLLVTSYGVDMGPLAKVMQENGFGFAVAIELDGEVFRSGTESESEAVWPSDGVGDH